jgi:hypothetical protein
MTHTTPEMIEAAKAVAAAVAKLPHVTRAWVDDWGRFGNFSLFLNVPESALVDLRAIRRGLTAAVQELAPAAKLRSVVLPRRKYRLVGRDRLFAGWDSDGRQFAGRGEASVSLDFHRYDAATNSFPAVQPNGPGVI